MTSREAAEVIGKSSVTSYHTIQSSTVTQNVRDMVLTIFFKLQFRYFFVMLMAVIVSLKVDVRGKQSWALWEK